MPAALFCPEFQRDFDWSDDRVSQLLATVARRWPAGSPASAASLARPSTSCGALKAVQRSRTAAVEYVVLDGQQRLTALYHAVYDTGPYVYAIRASALAPDATIDALEEAIRSFSREEWDAQMRHGAWDPNQDWIPFYALQSAADFFGWRDMIANRSPPEIQGSLREKLSDAYRFGLEAFHTYQLPAVIVEDDLEPAAIARIFERVNRGGLTLGAFDLMVARTFEAGWNLRDRWQRAIDEHAGLSELPDGMPLIRVIAMRTLGSVREADVLRLVGPAVRDAWEDAVTAYSDALRFLDTHCGVRSADWAPYGGMVVTLAGVALDDDLEHHIDVLRAWFFSNAFALRYETAANTVTVEEYEHVRRVCAGKVALHKPRMVDAIVREAARKRRSALWRALVCVLAANGARDPSTGEPISNSPSMVHILPRDDAPPPGQESRHLLVLNLLLVDRDARPSLQGAGLEALASTLDQLPAPARSDVMRSQLLSRECVDDNSRGVLGRQAERAVGLS